MLDYIRQIEVFDPDTFNTPVHVIGAGATGSWLVLALAKLGIKNITVWDFDDIEEHNIPNQAYRKHVTTREAWAWNDEDTDVGRPKVTALQQLAWEMSDITVNIKNEAVTGATRLEGIVICMTDTMKSRKEIWEGAVKFKVPVKLYIEPRMGLDSGRLYCVDPMNLRHIENYERTFYTDEEAEESACGASQSVVATAMMIASMVAWRVINYHNGEDMANQYLIDCRHKCGIMMNNWEG